MREEKVRFDGCNGKKVDGIIFYSEEENPPGIVMVHGFGGDGLSPYWLDTARELCNMGFCVFTFLFSGYNGLPDMRDVGIGDEIKELKMAMDFFVKETGIKNFFVFAQSLGSSVSVLLNDNRVRAYGLFAFNPEMGSSIKNILFTDDMIRKLESGESCERRSTSTGETRKIGPKFWNDLKKFGNLNKKDVRKIKKPVLLVWGTKDDYTNPAESVEIYEMFEEPKKIFMVENAPHVTFRNSSQRELVLRETKKWFGRYDS